MYITDLVPSAYSSGIKSGDWGPQLSAEHDELLLKQLDGVCDRLAGVNFCADKLGKEDR